MRFVRKIMIRGMAREVYDRSTLRFTLTAAIRAFLSLMIVALGMSAPAFAESLRVVTYNVKLDWALSQGHESEVSGLFLRDTRLLNAQIIGLQETCSDHDQKNLETYAAILRQRGPIDWRFERTDA